MPSPASQLPAIVDLAKTLVANAARCGHRATLVLSGEHGWCRSAATAIVAALAPSRLAWLGEAPARLAPLDVQTPRQLLGCELDAVVLDAWVGFDAEAFGAVAGSLKAGGLMLLLTPALAKWRDYPDPSQARLAVTPYTIEQISGRFLQHLAKTLWQSPGITLLDQDGPLPDIPREGGSAWQPPFTAEGVTVEQAEAVVAIERVAHGHRRRPLVLTSDRGRGKSAVLGIAAAGLLQRGTRHITVTAPRLAAVAQLFVHAERLLPGAQSGRGRLQWQGRCIEFVPPDALTLSPHDTELLLVDEAAAIPTPLLERMLAHYARIVYATTMHGYEGTGRGFALRFQKVLTQRTPGWHALRMNEPVRWAKGDPLERLSFRALLLDAEPVAAERISDTEVDSCAFERLEREPLIAGGADLEQLFGLLVLAHYHTSPNDLRHLLDGPNVRVYVLRQHGHIVATALVAEEGGLPAELAKGIYEGRRRAHGHLLAQSLAVHAGFAEAPTLRAWRVVRIAVHPALARRGLGRSLLRQLEGEARGEGLDYLGASFGGDEALLSFWHAAGWPPVRVGLKQEAASGSHALMVMKPLSRAGELLFHALYTRLVEQLPLLLAEPLSGLDAALVADLYRQLPAPALSSLSDLDWRDVRTFAEALRGYEVCLLALWRMAPIALADEGLADCLDERQRRLLVQKVLQRHDWRSLVASFELGGRGPAVVALRGCYRAILDGLRKTGRLPPGEG